MKKLYLFISLLLSLFVAACSSTNIKMSEMSAESTVQNAQVAKSEKLGTKWGDEISSNVTEVNLKRLSSSPIAESQVRYASKKYVGVHCLYFEMVSSIIYLAKMDKVINSNTKTIAIAHLKWLPVSMV